MTFVKILTFLKIIFKKSFIIFLWIIRTTIKRRYFNRYITQGSEKLTKSMFLFSGLRDLLDPVLFNGLEKWTS